MIDRQAAGPRQPWPRFLCLWVAGLLLFSMAAFAEFSPTGKIVYLDPATGEIRVEDLADPAAPSQTALSGGGISLGPSAAPRVRAPGALIVGGDWGGADLIPNDGDILSGTFTNVGTFHVMGGLTVFVDVAVPLSIEAQEILIEGVLDGSAAGFSGGAMAPNPEDPGNPGEGPGGGEGGGHGPCVHSSGGGGGGYGGDGGDSGSFFGTGPPPALGGSAYGSPDPPGVQMGSGGGAGGNHCVGTPTGGPGGAGGAAISLFGCTVDISGVVDVEGEAGTAADPGGAGGGGGSGGGIEVCGESGTVSGELLASGGDGADGVSGAGFGIGGGGGAGGRVKVSTSLTVTAFLDTSGGAGGTSAGGTTIQAEGGEDGTVALDGPSCEVCAVPTAPPMALAVLALLLVAGAALVLRLRSRMG